jgi:hypothetical protein
MRKTILAVSLAAAVMPAASALADPPAWAPAHGRRAHDRMYDDRGRYYQPRALTRNDEVWRGRDGRYYCALLGRAIDTRGDRMLGTLLGGAGGALLGREIDRGGLRCR